jgi:hypothetical protein
LCSFPKLVLTIIQSCVVGVFSLHFLQPQQDFSHLDETSLQQPSRKKWRIMQRLKRSGEGREHVAPIFVRRSDSKWSDSWQSQQVTTLQQLQLQDMALDDTYVVKATAEQAHETDVVLVDLDVQKVQQPFNLSACHLVSYVSRQYTFGPCGSLSLFLSVSVLCFSLFLLWLCLLFLSVCDSLL